MTTMTSLENVTSLGNKVSRRGFLKGAGGLTFAVSLSSGTVQFLTASQAKALPGQTEMSAWVRISPDNTITILTPGAEMGQGSMTSVPLILAEELDADWHQVFLDWAPAEPKVYGYIREWGGENSRSMGIYGSRAVMMLSGEMRAQPRSDRRPHER